jgi:hypothetical protein
MRYPFFTQELRLGRLLVLFTSTTSEVRHG